ncbi:hypothetical protein [Nocardia sp. NPDC047654]
MSVEDRDVRQDGCMQAGVLGGEFVDELGIDDKLLFELGFVGA